MNQAWNGLWLAFGFWVAKAYMESRDGITVSWQPAALFMTAWYLRMFYVEVGFPYVWIPWTVILVFLLLGYWKASRRNNVVDSHRHPFFAYEMMSIDYEDGCSGVPPQKPQA